jgi:hypothetical protein
MGEAVPLFLPPLEIEQQSTVRHPPPGLDPALAVNPHCSMTLLKRSNE